MINLFIANTVKICMQIKGYKWERHGLKWIISHNASETLRYISKSGFLLLNLFCSVLPHLLSTLSMPSPSLLLATRSNVIGKGEHIRSNAFRPGRLTKYELIVASRDTQKSLISSVWCKFCYSFGRETVDRKTKYGVLRSVVKHWRKDKAPFRT